MEEPIRATLCALLAWQPDRVAGQRLSVAHLADVAIDLRLELRERLKPAGVESDDELAGICDPVWLGVEIDAIYAEQRAVERSGEKTKGGRKPCFLIGCNWQV